MIEKPIEKAVALDAFGGSQSRLARALKISRQAVHKLPEGPIPERWALKLRYEIKPDIFGEAPAAISPKRKAAA